MRGVHVYTRDPYIGLILVLEPDPEDKLTGTIIRSSVVDISGTSSVSLS